MTARKRDLAVGRRIVGVRILVRDKEQPSGCPRCGSAAVAWDGIEEPIKWACGRCRFPLKEAR